MALPSEKKIFFLGIEGEQKGPFDDSEIEHFIKAKEIQRETLVWFEGLNDWQKVASLPNFKDIFDAVESGTAATESSIAPVIPGSQFKPLETSSESEETVAESREQAPTLKAVFADHEIEDGPQSKIDVKKTSKVLSTTIGLVGVLIAAVYFLLNPFGEPETNETGINTKNKQEDSREKEFRKTQSEFLLNPKKSIEIYEKLLKKNSKDEIGKKITSELLEYYNLHSPKEAGNLLLQLNRPEEAVIYFQKDPVDANALAEGLSKAFEFSKDAAQRKKYLSEQINLYLGVLNNQKLAIEKIKLFEKTFPEDASLYSYYLKNENGRLQDIFDRISFLFVDSLLNYVRSEIPEIKFTHRPTIEIRKAGNKYRIVGTYKGELTLNRDQLNNMHFSFWKTGDTWVLVETNLTKERSQWAREQMKKHEKEGYTETELLSELETVFKSRYPKKGLHEVVASEQAPTSISGKKEEALITPQSH